MVVLMVVFILIIGQIISGQGMSWREIGRSWILFLSSTLLLLISLFYWMWGFNYGRTTIGESYFNHEFIQVDSQQFMKRWALQTNRVNFLRKKAVVPTTQDETLTRDLSYTLRQIAGNELIPFGLTPDLQPLCKEFVPAGSLLRLNTAGFYFPFGSESYIDKALHVSQKPFVIAHELAHGYGVTDEGEANFIGYLLCQKSTDSYARYSSALSLWLYMASDGKQLDADFNKKMWDMLDPEVWEDLEARRELDRKYPEVFPKMRDAIYNSYLSMNKVEGGIRSYNRFVNMVLTYEDRNEK